MKNSSEQPPKSHWIGILCVVLAFLWIVLTSFCQPVPAEWNMKIIVALFALAIVDFSNKVW